MHTTRTPARLPRPSCRAAVLLAAALALAVAGVGCARPGGGGGAGPGHRRQTLGLSPQQEYRLGEQAYEQILGKAEVVKEGPEVDQVRRVGRRIVKAVQIEPLQREINLHLKGYTFQWEFNVLRDRQINAFCLPGGKVGVFTGLLRLTAGNDDMLATVLSHEVAHALAHHANERITREQMHRQALAAANGALGRLPPDTRHVLIGLLAGGTQLGSLAYDRKQESEADHIGLFLMTFAGYRPEAAIEFWLRMTEAARGRARPPAILSTHPSDARRIEQMRRWVPQARAALRAYEQGRVAPAGR